MSTFSLLISIAGASLLSACADATRAPGPSAPDALTLESTEMSDSKLDRAPDPGAAPNERNAAAETATLAAGCFWCIEAVLQQVEGVVRITSGYMGGTVPNPTYKQVCGGDTGHAEVVQVTFDPAVIGYAELLEWFWRLHDPTTLNRQGNDEGTQYRSAIFYHSEDQRRIALESRARAQSSGEFSDPIVTEITPAAVLYPAEEYHQDYYRQNRQQGYCRYVIAPKLDKLGLKK